MAIVDFIESSPETLGGQVVFKGTRVPVESLFDYLAKNESLMEFIEEFSSVSKEQAAEVIKFAGDLFAREMELFIKLNLLKKPE